MNALDIMLIIIISRSIEPKITYKFLKENEGFIYNFAKENKYPPFAIDNMIKANKSSENILEQIASYSKLTMTEIFKDSIIEHLSKVEIIKNMGIINKNIKLMINNINGLKQSINISKKHINESKEQIKLMNMGIKKLNKYKKINDKKV